LAGSLALGLVDSLFSPRRFFYAFRRFFLLGAASSFPRFRKVAHHGSRTRYRQLPFTTLVLIGTDDADALRDLVQSRLSGVPLEVARPASSSTVENFFSTGSSSSSVRILRKSFSFMRWFFFSASSCFLKRPAI